MSTKFIDCTPNEQQITAHVMRLYGGGGYATKLAEAWMHANLTNRRFLAPAMQPYIHYYGPQSDKYIEYTIQRKLANKIQGQ